MVGAAGLADGRVAVHQTVTQIVRRGDRDLGCRIENVLGRQRQPGDVRMVSIRPGISVLPPTSMTAASRTSTVFGDTETMRPSFTRTLNDGCSSANPSRTRLALVKSV